MNIVGTPWSAVQRSAAIALQSACGSNIGGQDDGRPVRDAGEVPITMPKQ